MSKSTLMSVLVVAAIGGAAYYAYKKGWFSGL